LGRSYGKFLIWFDGKFLGRSYGKFLIWFDGKFLGRSYGIFLIWFDGKFLGRVSHYTHTHTSHPTTMIYQLMKLAFYDVDRNVTAVLPCPNCFLTALHSLSHTLVYM
jgi:hypothetical protein